VRASYAACQARALSAAVIADDRDLLQRVRGVLILLRDDLRLLRNGDLRGQRLRGAIAFAGQPLDLDSSRRRTASACSTSRGPASSRARRRIRRPTQ
jgi:hypothetical protein